MFTVGAVVLTFSLFISCEAGFVDTLTKCSIKDETCIKEVFQHIIKTVGSTGLAELEVPALDHIDLDNISVNILNDVTVTITKVSVKGMTNCVFNSYRIDWEKERAFLNITCDALSVKGQFVMSGENPEIQSFINSNTLNGQGRAKIKLDNTNLNIEYSMFAKKKDGVIYLMVSNKNIKYTYDVGKAHFITEKVIIANNDLSQVISAYLNDNWRIAVKQFGPVVMDKALEMFVGLIADMCAKLPANKYIIEDLHSYLKN